MLSCQIGGGPHGGDSGAGPDDSLWHGVGDIVGHAIGPLKKKEPARYLQSLASDPQRVGQPAEGLRDDRSFFEVPKIRPAKDAVLDNEEAAPPLGPSVTGHVSSAIPLRRPSHVGTPCAAVGRSLSRGSRALSPLGFYQSQPGRATLGASSVGSFVPTAGWRTNILGREPVLTGAGEGR